MIRKVITVLLLLLLVGCQQTQTGGNNGTIEVTISGDLESNLQGARVFADYNNFEGMPEHITIGLTQGSGNNMTIFSLTLPPQPEVRDYPIIGPPRNPQARSTINSVEASLFYASGNDLREYSQGVTGQLTFTEVGETLSGNFEATLFYGNLASGAVDNTRSVQVNGTFSLPNPHP